MLNFNLNLEPGECFVIGEDEKWTYITNKSVLGVEQNRYIVSTFGRSYDLKLNKRCKSYEFGGYITLSLKTDRGYKTFLLHRIVIIEFIGFDSDPNKTIVNHIDGIKHCCALCNLEWVSDYGNKLHAYENDLLLTGEDSDLAKLTNEEALNIMYQLRDGIPIDKIIDSVPSKILNPTSCVNAILRGRAWRRLVDKYNITFSDYEDRSVRYTEDQLLLIGKLLEQNLSYKDILVKLGYDINNMSDRELKLHSHTISDIRTGRSYKYISENFNVNHEETADAIFTMRQIHDICKIYQDGFISYDDTLMKLGINPKNLSKEERFRFVNALSAIRRRKNFKNISSKYNF